MDEALCVVDEKEWTTWRCPNMQEKEGDLDMEYERYECKVCGKTMKLDYEEMR